MLDFFEGPLAAEHSARFLEEVCGAGLFSWDLRGDDMRWSRGLYALLGLPDETPPTWTLLKGMVHPSDRIEDVEFKELLASGLPFTRNLRLIRRNGRPRWVSVYHAFIVDAFGTATRLVGIFTDVTNIHVQNQQLNLGQANLRKMLADVAPVAWVANAAGMTTQVSGWHALTGRPDSSALGMDWVEGLHINDRERAVDNWRRAIRLEQTYEDRYRIIRPAGDALYVRSIAAPILAGDDRQWSGLLVNTAPRHDSQENTLTGAQIRAARAILRWSVSDLSQSAGVSPAVIRRLEDIEGPIPRDVAVSGVIAKTFTAAGVVLVFQPDQPPGVRPAMDRWAGACAQSSFTSMSHLCGTTKAEIL